METIGGVDKVDLPDLNLENVPAKVDTGANRSSIHCDHIRKVTENGIDYIEFHIPSDLTIGKNIIRTDSFFQRKIKSSTAHVEERYVIFTTVVIFGRSIKTTFSLTDRSEMKYPILLGRRMLHKKFLVDVSQKDLSYKMKLSREKG